MDTTQKNIEMCRKAVEIQKLWEPESGDWYIRVNYNSIISTHLLSIVNECEACDVIKEKSIWLPRQDQLQRMIGTNPFNLIARFWSWSIKVDKIYLKSFTSMEQLWLAFVMHEKYQKKWDGENW